ncbi:sugar ABC transporter substrate-binding protein [Xanthomonas rydalmerensis]|uniref:Sugar ABC transporter substrate-binding protein n=1 Tax=Xanthomonas rydalmerensis TaxID=3046274 RepID=A0ABZ0JTF3_9XANT|nr:sugar ABC transporter substrate-binding protein [Xanthomonas sp. DM-2023]WOS42992.1 sugar ABC transporter substrate-binding protein [Xanthomonas sp. DM-2023]WOS47174.1 sugar ABC transporter substrate-binding protein [Xanthomonas sp. DM-2023]WOS51354.1 sugar ABC transporter substrate-binding protein [Xanthomonas sp. DM-2023]WOS55537.1 sugar ABC transporter substrate-binding protein [Xanthomonas sp. DM-2023]WOS59718.1 sugar ABC transporter substrate-binding protein [Xanthomonas sp. DM-2023]
MIGRWFSLGLLVVAICGCARAPQGEVVRFWAMGREAEVVAELIPQFEKENPGIHVDIQNIPWTAAHEKLLTAFAADGLPDVCQLGNTWIPEFAELGTLQPLQPYVDRSKVVDPKDYFPGIWDTSVIDGHLYGIPWYVDTRLLFYRKDMLRDAGVTKLPQTWAEWEQAMAAVKQHVGPKRYAILMPLNEFEQQLSLGLQLPDPLLRDNNNYGNFESPGFRKALAFYANMFDQGWAPKMSETQISNVWDEFFNGFYAFYISGPWNIREFRKVQPPALKDQWGTMPLPGPDGPGAGIAGGTSLVIFRKSEHKDAAWKLIEFLSRPQIQARFHALIGDMPPRRSTWAYPSLADDPLAHAFRDQLERVKPAPKVLEWERIVQEMRLATERVVRGGEPQEKAMQELDKRVDEILEKRRWIHQQHREGTAAPAAGATP